MACIEGHYEMARMLIEYFNADISWKISRSGYYFYYLYYSSLLNATIIITFPFFNKQLQFHLKIESLFLQDLFPLWKLLVPDL